MKGLNKLLNYDFADYGSIIVGNKYYPDQWMPFGTISGDTDLGLVITTSYAFTGDRSFMLYKTGANNQGMSQTVDFEYNIYGLTFDIGMWIKVSTQTSANAIKLSYKWLNSSGTLIGSQVTIATITSTQNFTLHSVSGVTAPKGTYKIWLGVETTGSDQPLLAFADDPYIYGGSEYGCKVYDESGNSSTIIPDVSSIIASGTVSMPDTLQDDDTYGVDIDLPGDEYIDTKNIGVIVQARDFDWELVVNILPYDSGNKFWGNFFGDDAVTYYEKAVDGVMTTWSAGAMTPGSPSTYNFAVNVDLFAGWDRSATSIKKVRLFAALFYTFLKTVAGGTTTSSLFARNYQSTVNGAVGYALSSTAGETERYYEYKGWDLYGEDLYGPVNKFDIFIVHSDGTETQIGTDVALCDSQWYDNDPYVIREEQLNATFDCPETVLVTSDALKFVLKVNGIYMRVHAGKYYFQNWSFSLPFITPQLGWTILNAATWTLYRYLWFMRVDPWQEIGSCRTRTYWGDTKEMKITGISHDTTASAAQRVCSIGSEGIGEVDYIIYQKDYDGS